MPKYNYTAIDLRNKKVKGTVDARDNADLRRVLRNQELVPVSTTVVDDVRTRYRMKAHEVSEFSRQISSMLQSGITVLRALEIIKDRDFKPPIRAIYQRLYKDVQQGFTLSEAMRLQGHAFPELLINIYMSGEATGQLERSADKMSTHYDKENRLNGKVKTAMTYPIILAVVTVGVIIGLFAFILPEFFKIFENMSAPIPIITTIMIGISNFLCTKYALIIAFILIVVFGIKLLLRLPPVRLQVDRYKLRMPIAGKLLKIIFTARFSRTLSSLYSSGLSMLNALEISATTIGNQYISSQFEALVTDVRNGEPLSESVAKVIGFDKKLSTTILIGEESGRLDTMLESVAESYDFEADQAIGRLVQMIEPAMLIVMAIVVCLVMVSVFMPLMSLYQSIA